MRDEERGKRLIAIFLLGLVLLNFPLLAVVDEGGLVFGIPVLFAYVFGAWAGLILGLALLVEARTPEGRATSRRDRP